MYIHIFTHTHSCFPEEMWLEKKSLDPLKPLIFVAIRGNFLKEVPRIWHTGPYYYILTNLYKNMKGGWKEDGAKLFSVVPVDWKRGDGHKLKHGKPSEHEENPFSLWEWLSTDTGCAGSLLNLLPWRYQKMVCTWSWATGEQGDWTRWLPEVPFNLYMNRL